MVMNNTAPNLTKLSKHESGSRYTLLGKRKVIEYNDDKPAPNKYDVRGKSEITSKFRAVSQPCSFSKQNRWGVADKSDNVTAGPGESFIN